MAPHHPDRIMETVHQGFGKVRTLRTSPRLGASPGFPGGGDTSMSSELILGRVHPDLACAVALAIVEDPSIVATVEALTVHGPGMRPLGTVRGWLRADDPLHAATNQYLL